MRKRLFLFISSLLFVCIISPFTQVSALTLNGEQVDWAKKWQKEEISHIGLHQVANILYQFPMPQEN